MEDKYVLIRENYANGGATGLYPMSRLLHAYASGILIIFIFDVGDSSVDNMFTINVPDDSNISSADLLNLIMNKINSERKGWFMLSDGINEDYGVPYRIPVAMS